MQAPATIFFAMKRFKVDIELGDGNQVHAKVTARNKNDAFRRVQMLEQFKQFQTAEIVAWTVEPIPIESVDNSRFAVTNITNKQGWYVVADLDNRIKIEWKKGMYNETQRISFIGDAPATLDELAIASALREIDEYLYTNFKELV